MTPRKKSDVGGESAPKRSRTAKVTEPEPVAEVTPEAEEPPARTSDAVSDLPDIDRMIVFHMAGQRYGIAITAVQEIQQIVAFAEVPAGVDSIIGMINLRGRVIPAFDMRLLLGLPVQDFHVDTPMIICKSEGQLVALVVDEVEDVVVLPEGCMSAPPRMHALSGRMVAVCRMGMDLIYLLDVDKLMEPVSIPGAMGV